MLYNLGFNLCIGGCSRKRFSEKQAEQWWAENRARVYELYNVRLIDKSSIGVGSEELAHWLTCIWDVLPGVKARMYYQLHLASIWY